VQILGRNKELAAQSAVYPQQVKTGTWGLCCFIKVIEEGTEGYSVAAVSPKSLTAGLALFS